LRNCIAYPIDAAILVWALRRRRKLITPSNRSNRNCVAILREGHRVLERFVGDKYSTKHAVRDVLRHWQKLNLKRDGLSALADSEEFYHLYSHVTLMTVGAVTSMAEGGFYIGASFDKGKTGVYDVEVKTRIGLAKQFPNFVEAVAQNVAAW
jgi:hypothetical protein